MLFSPASLSPIPSSIRSFHFVLRSATPRRFLSYAKPCRLPLAKNYDPALIELDRYRWWKDSGFFSPLSSSIQPEESVASPSGDQHLRNDPPSQPRQEQQQEGQRHNRFIMLCPPPNVTGDLHVGHALTFSIQDSIARYQRMKGRSVQWIPGTDHAGIGTQTVVERQLMRDRKLTRHDLGRDKFNDYVWNWREKYGEKIMMQLSQLGASLDYNSLFFTLDGPRSQAVKAAFVRLHKDGLLYRENRIVNWCCRLGTVISDIEVDYETINGRTMLEIPGRPDSVETGVLHKVAYKIASSDHSTSLEGKLNSDDELVVATTRIETVLGDVALAIHPDDDRYKQFHGKHVVHPLTGKRLPIVLDAELVDMTFGSGVVKITPAHDPNDFLCSRRHNLEVISIFNGDGTMRADCGIDKLANRDRFAVRGDIIDMLTASGLYRGKSTDHEMSIARCSRSGDIIEPMVVPQWYLRCEDMATNVMHAVDAGNLILKPEMYNEKLKNWLEVTNDWCISRQLWWGHQIPAYRVEFAPNSPIQQFAMNTSKDDIHNTTQAKDAGRQKPRYLVDSEGNDMWFVAETAEDAEKQVLKYSGLQQSDRELFRLIQDEDVLDTWFSSALLPLSALGWKGEKAIPASYPTTMLETGSDILFFWVARMAMLCMHFSGQVPFNKVLLHELVRDAQGRKMSKSLGNVIDPLHVIHGVSLATLKTRIQNSNLSKHEIKKSIEDLSKEFPQGIASFGADSLRFALLQYTRENDAINMDLRRVQIARQFTIKLWNLTKYTFFHMEATSYCPPNPISHRSPDQLEHLLWTSDGKQADIALVDRYILSRLAQTVKICERAYEEDEMGLAADTVKDFVMRDLCDVYVEFSKPVLYGEDGPRRKNTMHILTQCLDTSLRILHPLMPFITEEIWQSYSEFTNTGDKKDKMTLMKAESPKSSALSSWIDLECDSDMKAVLSVLQAARSLRHSSGQPLTRMLTYTICMDERVTERTRSAVESHLDILQLFAKAEKWNVLRTHAPTLEILPTISISTGFKISLETPVPVATLTTNENNSQLERNRIEKKLEKLLNQMSKYEERMASAEFIERAKKEVQESARKTYEKFREEKLVLEQELKRIQST